jgi:hypothetical protein
MHVSCDHPQRTHRHADERASFLHVDRRPTASSKYLQDSLHPILKKLEHLELTENRFKGGVAPRADVAQAQTQLDTTLVQDTDVTVQRAQFEHAIAILIGKPPADFSLAASPPTRDAPTNLREVI